MYRKMIWLLLVFSAFSATAQTDTVLVITNGQLIDGTGAEPIENGTVVIENERIIAVGASDEIAIPEEATLIDADGGTILPGIINAHTHRARDLRIRYTNFTQRGVTTICDMASPINALEDLAQTTLPDGTLGGRAGRSGPFITVEGGYPGPVFSNDLNYTLEEAGSPADAVATLRDAGATYIKVGIEPAFDNLPLLTDEQLQAIVSAAHENDMLVQAHVQNADYLEMALDADIDVLHHVPVPATAIASLAANRDVMLSDAFTEQLERAIAMGVILVPTLDVFVPADDVDVNQLQRWYGELAVIVTSEYIALGGQVALGNDFGNPGVQSGIPIREMQL
ncbi:MAG: amidohydrolase family protein, partial [Chloroflexota bacterium]